MVQSKEIDALLEQHVNKLICKVSSMIRDTALYLQIITGDIKQTDRHAYYHALNHLKWTLDRVYGPNWLDNWIKSDVE